MRIAYTKDGVPRNISGFHTNKKKQRRNGRGCKRHYKYGNESQKSKDRRKATKAKIKEIMEQKKQISKLKQAILIHETTIRNQQSTIRDQQAAITSLKQYIMQMQENESKLRVTIHDVDTGKDDTIMTKKRKLSSGNNWLAKTAEDNEKVKKVKKELEDKYEDVKDDLDIVNDTLDMQSRTTDIWQTRFDEVYKLAEGAGVDASVLTGIRDRSLAEGR
eukprot:g13983.t1